MSAAVEMRVYRGLARRERAGWVAGLTPAQAIACVALVAPVLVCAAAGWWSRALLLAAIDSVGVALVVVPVRGRTAARWLADLVLFQIGVLMGWSRWQSRAAAGVPGPADEPDLPGVLTRLQFPDGPSFRGQGRVCLIHDTAEARWGATARLTHSGVGLLSAAECDRLASRLGNLLLALGHREAVDRLSLLVRTVPDHGREYDLWRRTHATGAAPELARAATTELDGLIGAVSVRTELFVTVSGSEDALRRPAQAAGGGVTGRALALYRVLDGLDDALKGLGVRTVTWLGPAGMAEAIRTGFNPAAQAALTSEQLSGAAAGLPLAAAGPTLAPAPAARRYDHDGFSSISYAVLMPEAGTVFGSLAPLLTVRTAGERRTLAIHYEVLGARAASRSVQTNRFRANVMTDWKRTKGFNATAVEERQAGGAVAQERAVAAGHTLVRFAAAASITVPTGWNLEDHAARLENDAAGRFRLLRLELAQDSGFVCAALPVGIGLPRTRGALS